MSENESDGVTPDQASGTVVKAASDLGWRAALPDDLKNHDMVKSYTKPGDLVQDYIKIKQEAGKLARIPDEQATDEEKTSFFEKLGYPKDGKYGFQKPEGIPDNAFDTEALSGFEKMAGDLRLTKSQAEGLYNWYNTYVGKKLQGVTSAASEAMESLKQEWAGDSFDKNVSIASRAFKEVCSSEVGTAFTEFINTREVDGLKLGNHPLFLKYFYELGKSVLEDSASVKKAQIDTSGAKDEDAIAAKMFPSMVSKK